MARASPLGPFPEGIARPSAAGATCAVPVAERSAGPRPAGIRSSSALRCPLHWLHRGASSSSGRDRRPILPPLFGFPGATNFASVPTSIFQLRSPPPLATPPTPGRARAHSLTLAGARAHARAPRAAESPAPLSRSHSPGRCYSHRLPAATGRPLSAAAAAARAAAAVWPRLAALRPGRSPVEARSGGDAEATRSRAAPRARLP